MGDADDNFADKPATTISREQSAEEYPSEGYPSEGYPSEGYPSEGYPSEGYPSEGMEDLLNTSLGDVLNLLAQEVDRLKTSLEFHRNYSAENAADIVRWHVQEIDRRQDRMDELKDIILAAGDTSLH